MERNELRNATILVAGDAIVSAISADGQLLWSEGLPLGSHKAAQFLPRMAEGDTLEVEGAATPMMRGTDRARRVKYGDGSHDSGANPHFVVTSASRHQRELERQLKVITDRSDKLDRRLAALDAASKARTARLRAGEDNEAVTLNAESASDEPAKEPAKEPAEKENGGS